MKTKTNNPFFRPSCLYCCLGLPWLDNESVLALPSCQGHRRRRCSCLSEGVHCPTNKRQQKNREGRLPRRLAGDWSPGSSRGPAERNMGICCELLLPAAAEAAARSWLTRPATRQQTQQ